MPAAARTEKRQVKMWRGKERKKTGNISERKWCDRYRERGDRRWTFPLLPLFT